MMGTGVRQRTAERANSVRLYLVRHAQSESNVRGALDTAPPGAPLTELGTEQAAELGQRLAGAPIVAVYSSRATRAQQTAAAVARARELEVQVIDGVHEISAGELEDHTDSRSIETYQHVIGQWAGGALDVRMPGGETGREVRQRFLDAVGELDAKHEQTQAGVAVLVCHGALLRLGSEWLTDNVTSEVTRRELLPNTALIELERLAAGRWHCVNWAGLAL